MGKHSRQQARHVIQRRAIETLELVDTTDITGTAHRVTVDAAAEGLPRGRYITVCGGDVRPAAMVTREARHCRLCAPVPTQRSRGSRR